jgi:hypothetical protein
MIGRAVPANGPLTAANGRANRPEHASRTPDEVPVGVSDIDPLSSVGPRWRRSPEVIPAKMHQASNQSLPVRCELWKFCGVEQNCNIVR